MTAQDAKATLTAPLTALTDLGPNVTRDIASALTMLLSDFFAPYLKSKNFHWHISGPYFRGYHLMVDDQGAQIFAVTDAFAEHAGGIARRQSKPRGLNAERASAM